MYCEVTSVICSLYNDEGQYDLSATLQLYHLVVEFIKHRRSISRDIRMDLDQTLALTWSHQPHADQKSPAIYS